MFYLANTMLNSNQNRKLRKLDNKGKAPTHVNDESPINISTTSF